MSLGELAWRARGAARDWLDRIRIPLRLIPSASTFDPAHRREPAFRLTEIRPGEWTTGSDDRAGVWATTLTARAERLLQRKFSFFDLDDVTLGQPLQWNFDAARRVSTPTRFAPLIDYRDYEVTGDCKVVWEPSRHHQLVVLARAYRATGDERFAKEVVAQIDSWVVQCPFGYGMQWRSPLELAIRAINWIWAYDLIRDSGAFGERSRVTFAHTLYLHLWDVSRKYSKGSSANNHLIGEAAGVFVGSSYFPDMPQCGRWREDSAAILEQQIVEQTYEDGGGREQAFGYHGFVLQFFIAAAVVARQSGFAFSTAYLKRIERMLEFAAGMIEGGPAPMFGDADDGYVLDLGSRPADLKDLLAVGSVLFARPEFKPDGDAHAEPVAWLFGRKGLEQYDALPSTSAGRLLTSRAFPATGYYVLQTGTAHAEDSISAIFDCAELGFGPIAAHGHADALSLTVRAFGEDVLVDPGTYDYFTHPEWREYFRSTKAHNTLVVDSADQSVPLGPFLWGHRAQSRLIAWCPSDPTPAVEGSHDGFTRLSDPVTHQRRIELDRRAGTLTVRDRLLCAQSHHVSIFFHLSERCDATPVHSHRIQISVAGGQVDMLLDPSLAVEIVRAREEPPLGWVSRSYHRRSASTTIVGTRVIDGSTTLVTTLQIGRDREPPRLVHRPT